MNPHLLRLPLTLLMLAALVWATASHGTTFSVSNTNDSGAGSLRQAVADANASAGLALC